MGIKKTCESCKEEFETGRYRTQRFCSRTCTAREYRKNNKEQFQAYRDKRKDKAKAWRQKDYQENKEKWLSWSRGNWHLYREQRAEYYQTTKYTLESRFTRSKALATRRGKEWKLTFEQFSLAVSDTCHYCQGPVKTTVVGLDRVDNEKGYEVDNVVACCSKCNWRKWHEQERPK